jgi:hypothetical protein
MAYDQIDRTLQSWATSLNVPIFKEFGGRECRFLYLTNLKNDCYQIDIKDNGNSKFCISIYFIDGDSYKEGYELHIPTSIDKLSNDLHKAHTIILSL